MAGEVKGVVPEPVLRVRVSRLKTRFIRIAAKVAVPIPMNLVFNHSC